MFGKLKEALKKSFSIFSKNVEEKAEEIPTKKAEASSEPIPIPKKTRQAEQSDKDTIIKKKFSEKKEFPTQTNKLPEKEKVAEKNQVIEENQISESASETEKKQNIFAKAKELLTTRRLSKEKFEELFWDIEIALLENNVAVEVVQLMKDGLKEKLTNKQLPRDLGSVVKETVKETIDTILIPSSEDLVAKAKKKKPFVIAFFGINGSGKTTTIAKVAHLLKENKTSCVIAAADTFRAAAIQQIEEHGARLGIKVIKHDYGSDAAAVAFDAISYAKKNNVDIVLIDTAGRLHSDTNLMDELKKIVRIAKPDLKIFVGESITGNDCIEQTKQFDECTGIDVLILTKADVDEKGGTALSISYVTKKPILYLGMGQSYTDLKPFNKEMIMQNLGLS